MRATSLLRRVLPFRRLQVRSVRIEAEAIEVHVGLRGRSRCSGCGRKCPRYDRLRARAWRHLDVSGWRVRLVYAPWRVECRRCGVVVEQVTWAAPRSRFTYLFEDLVAWLAQQTSKTAITDVLRISWRTVGAILERVVSRRRRAVDPSRLRAISVDEISWRKGHRYLTLVVDLERQRVIWGTEGRSAASLERFLDEIGEEACQRIEYVAIDMAQAYMSAVKRRLPRAKIVFDRFHVQRVVSDAVDEVRRQEWRASRGTREGAVVKGTRYPLLKAPWKLTDCERDSLARLQAENRRLYRAYLLKEAFCDIFRRLYSRDTARRRMRAWMSWASRSRLAPFVQAGRTIRRHLEGILNYFDTGFTTSPSEGLNNKARLATRQAYGFHSALAALAMIELRCTGLTIPLPHF